MPAESTGAPPDDLVAVPVDVLSSYVPEFVARRFASDPRPPTGPASDQLDAVLLECDISGFTSFTESLALAGPAGAEEVSSALSRVFGRLADLIADHGGDVIKFAGDALLAIWPIVKPEDDAGDAVRVASRCAFALQTALREDPVALEHGLNMRAGVGVGEITTLHLGGVAGAWDIAVVGDALSQVASAQSASELGSVTLSPEAWMAISGTLQQGPVPASPEAIGDAPALPSRPFGLDDAARGALASYIPSAVTANLAAGQSGYMAELRRLSVMFVDLPAITAGPSLDVAQEIVVALQRTLDRFEGQFHKLSIDDKGVKLVGVFGLPPQSHEDDPVRAVLAGREMMRDLAELGIDVSIGVTTGRSFCGVVGSESRREFTVIGDMVNLAARLMGAADGGMLCDEETYQAAQMRISFRASRPIAIKGKTDPVTAYSPTGEHSDELGPGGSVLEHRTELVGRSQEASTIDRSLSSLLNGHGEALVVEGEAGIGKSRLVEYLLLSAKTAGVRSLIGAGDAIESASPYRAWRPILKDLLGLDGVTSDAEAQRAQILEALASGDELSVLAPLLSGILPVDIPDNELTSAMSADVRADNIQTLVTHLTQEAADDAPLLVVFDDAQWLDPSSWQLVRHVFGNVRPLAVGVATRPPGDPPPTEYAAFLRAANPHLVSVGPMPPADITTLVCNTLGIEELEDEVMELLHDKAEGHPMFSKELAYFLRNEGLVVTQPPPTPGKLPSGVLAPDADLNDVRFPDTVQVVITTRIDRLDVRQQLLLKVAAVIGRSFSADLLKAVLPVETSQERFEADLDRLVGSDLITLEQREPVATYAFSHAIIQEVSYGLLPYADKREIHAAIAEWYEREFTDLEPHLPVLAHHWTAAEDDQRAVGYQAMAGEQALANFANEEAITYLTMALETANGLSPPIDNHSLADWQLHLGAAQVHWSRYPEARDHLQQGLSLLGHDVPHANSLPAKSWSLAKVLVRHWKNRLFGSGKPVAEPADRAVILTASRGYTRLVEAAFLSGDQWLALYSSFHALNLAQRASASPELAEAFGPVGVVYGAIPLRAEAGRYLGLAVQTARQVDSPSALGYALLAHGTYSIGAADWSTARAMADDLVDLGRKFGSRKRLNDGLQLLTSLGYLQGHFDSVLPIAGELLTSARRSHDPRFSAYAYFAKAYADLYLGRHEQALESLERIPALLDAESETTDRMLDLMHHALLALIHLRMGHHVEAFAAANGALDRQAGGTLDLGYAVPGYALTASVLLELWESGHDDPSLKQSAKRATQSLRKFSRLFEVARPYSKQAEGSLARLSGKRRKAVRSYKAAIESAAQTGMLFTEGTAHLELARQASDDAERTEHAERARRIFTDLATPFELDHADRLLKGE